MRLVIGFSVGSVLAALMGADFGIAVLFGIVGAVVNVNREIVLNININR